MEETSREVIVQHIESQRAFFSTNKTKDINFRLAQLSKLKNAIHKNQKKIEDALWEDYINHPRNLT